MRLDDGELVRRYVERRDEAAFRALVERHAGAVLRAAHAVTRDRQAAEDVVQETFLVASRTLGRCERLRSVKAWLIRIAIRRALNAGRARRRAERRERKVAMSEPRENATPAERLEHLEALEMLDEAVGDLPPKKRVALLLHYRDGLTLGETAEALGVAPGTAKSRIGRGLEALRRALSKRGASLSVAALPELLHHLPAPDPSASLIAACAAAPTTAGTAAVTGGAIAAKKVVAAALLVAAAATGGVLGWGALDSSRGDAPRATTPEPPREMAVEERGAFGEPQGTPGTPAPEVSEPAPETVAVAPPGSRSVSLPGPTAGERVVTSLAPPREVAEPVAPGPVAPIRGAGSSSSSGGVRAGGSSMAPMPGRSSRFAPPPPPKGTATVKGIVRDAAGMPVAGADVYRIANGVDRSAGTILSFEHLRLVATTGEDGAFTAAEQVQGTFLLAPNYQRFQNRPRGMETAPAIGVTVSEGEEAAGVELALPFVVADLGSLRGQVLDEDGKPVARAQVFVGYVERFTDAQGMFDAGRVLPGECEVSVRRTGYKTNEGVIAVARAEAVFAQLTLELAQKGALFAAGRVTDDKGAPIAGAAVYVCSGNGTVRSGRTDAEGQFRFEKLPDRLVADGAHLIVWAQGYYTAGKHELNLPVEGLALSFPHSVKLRLRFVDDVTGEPLQQIACEAKREVQADGGAELRMFRSFSVFREDGTYELECPATKVVLEVEAADHAKSTIDVDLATGEAERDLVVRLPRAAPGGG